MKLFNIFYPLPPNCFIFKGKSNLGEVSFNFSAPELMFDRYAPSQIARLTDSVLLKTGTESQVCILHYVYDTRLGLPGKNSLFIALGGSFRDGHDFLASAYEIGFRCFWVRSDRAEHLNLPSDPSITVIASERPERALQVLAGYHRLNLAKDLIVVGITGSNGKTIVKEWMATLSENILPTVKSPKSYNSQLGVALSLLQINSEHRLALIEAGISQKGEMDILSDMIRPEIGIFTHLGDAHAEGFASETEKLREKCKLFDTCKTVLAPEGKTYIPLLREILGQKLKTVPPYEEISRLFKGDEVSIQNASLALAGIYEVLDLINISPKKKEVLHAAVRLQLANLEPVSMRLEISDDHPDITILNDAYNADRDSVIHAVRTLIRINKQPKRFIFLTDLEHQGTAQKKVQQELLEYLSAHFDFDKIICIGPIFQDIIRGEGNSLIHSFLSVEEVLTRLSQFDFRRAGVLVKGARKYRPERIIPHLEPQPNATVFKINLNSLKENFLFLKKQLPPDTFTIAMVKASAYGSGAWQVARELTDCGADAFAVAFTGEGVELRKKGIKKPILILNPNDRAPEILNEYRLEPAVGSFTLLKKIANMAEKSILFPGFCFHIEWDTGMGRLGFSEQEAATVRHFLENNGLADRVQSFFTHFASADDPAADDFSSLQTNRFGNILTHFEGFLFKKGFYIHRFNTAGLLRFGPEKGIFPEAVRLGIGLYGIDPTGNFPQLQEVGRLETVISQIHEYPPGTPVGYGGSQITERLTRVATVPIGYADGFPRRLGNGRYAMQVAGKPALVIGRVCMDMTMLDVTDIREAEPGSSVTVFGPEHSVIYMSDAADTIPYEILAGISTRVRRIYEKE